MAELTTTAGASAPFDRAALLERVEGDVELLSEIVGLFLEESPSLLAGVAEAVAAGNAAGLKRAAHTLKGAASNFGATEVVAVALELEAIGRSGNLAAARAACDRLEGALAALTTALAPLAG
jgi:HPt (histidine-containing phosphotransfer) domain-containing protein